MLELHITYLWLDMAWEAKVWQVIFVLILLNNIVLTQDITLERALEFWNLVVKQEIVKVGE